MDVMLLIMSRHRGHSTRMHGSVSSSGTVTALPSRASAAADRSGSAPASATHSPAASIVCSVSAAREGNRTPHRGQDTFQHSGWEARWSRSPMPAPTRSPHLLHVRSTHLGDASKCPRRAVTSGNASPQVRHLDSDVLRPRKGPVRPVTATPDTLASGLPWE